MPDTATLILRLLDAPQELEDALGDEWPSIRERILALLLRLDAADDDASLRGDLDRLLADLLGGPAAASVRALVSPRADVGGGTTRGSLGFAGDEDDEDDAADEEDSGPPGTVEIPVYFGTDRAENEANAVNKRFTGDRGELTFGVARVTLPTTERKKGQVSRPKWWRFQRREDPAQHVVLHELSTLARADYVATLTDALRSADAKDALLFVHGFNVDFASAARQTAQIAHDLEFPGCTALYSWPSKGGLLGYAADAATVEWSTPHFEEFLRLLLTEIEADTVHVIAHSMGNRALVRALERFDASTLPPGSARLRQIVFAAPDVDTGVFERISEAFAGRAERLTLYASKNDFALRVSRLLHRFPRAGDAGESLVVVDSVDTIDASKVDTSLFGLGHSYFAKKPRMLADIYHLLRGDPPDQRFGLLRQTSRSGIYWLCQE